MTEREKMMKGLLYDANFDPELLRQRTECKELCYDYNHTRPSDEEKRTEILKRLFKATGEHLTIEQPFVCDYGYNISVGEGFFANYNLVILDPAPVTFGDNVFIAPNCSFTTASHPLDAERRNKGLETCKPIHVGNNVWIGANVVVLPGVTIGDNAVIGAGSVVTRDIPTGYVAYGNPCKPHRKIENQ